MPITFAQPGVVNAGVDQTIGTGQADEAMVGTVASAYENAARLRSQAMMSANAQQAQLEETAMRLAAARQPAQAPPPVQPQGPTAALAMQAQNDARRIQQAGWAEAQQTQIKQAALAAQEKDRQQAMAQQAAQFGQSRLISPRDKFLADQQTASQTQALQASAQQTAMRLGAAAQTEHQQLFGQELTEAGRQYETEAGRAQQGQQFEEERADRGYQFEAGRADRADEEDAQNQLAARQQSQRAYEFDASRQPSERDQFEAQHQMEINAQKAQLSTWQMGQEMGMQDQMRYSHMKAAVSEVMNNPDLSDEEKVNLGMKIKTGIDMYDERMKNVRANKENEMMQVQLHTAAREEAMRTQNENNWAAMAPGGIYTHTNPDGTQVDIMRDGKGGYHEIDAKGNAARQAAQDRQAQFEERQSQAAEDRYWKARNTYAAEASHTIKDTTDLSGETTDRSAQRQTYIDQQMRNHFGDWRPGLPVQQRDMQPPPVPGPPQDEQSYQGQNVIWPRNQGSNPSPNPAPSPQRQSAQTRPTLAEQQPDIVKHLDNLMTADQQTNPRGSNYIQKTGQLVKGVMSRYSSFADVPDDQKKEFLDGLLGTGAIRRMSPAAQAIVMKLRAQYAGQ